MNPSRIGQDKSFDPTSYSTGQETGPDNTRRSTSRPSTDDNPLFSGLRPRPAFLRLPGPEDMLRGAPASTSPDLPGVDAMLTTGPFLGSQRSLAQATDSDLLSELIGRRNTQDFQGAPLPSGASVRSRVTGSTHASRFSAVSASGQYQPPSIASTSTGRVPASIGDRQRPAPYPPSLSRSSGTGMVGAGPGPSWRQKVVDPETGETISKNALAKRQKVVDPETGETISKNALAKRQKVVDPETGETISKGALAMRQKVVDPETGETISKTALAKRQKVVDPETGETISKNALALRQKRRGELPPTGTDRNQSAPARQMTGNPEGSNSRPIVALSSRLAAVSRSWNAGDRFSIPGPDGNLQEIVVTRNRHGGEEVYKGDFQLLLRGG